MTRTRSLLPLLTLVAACDEGGIDSASEDCPCEETYEISDECLDDMTGYTELAVTEFQPVGSYAFEELANGLTIFTSEEELSAVLEADVEGFGVDFETELLVTIAGTKGCSSKEQTLLAWAADDGSHLYLHRDIDVPSGNTCGDCDDGDGIRYYWHLMTIPRAAEAVVLCTTSFSGCEPF